MITDIFAEPWFWPAVGVINVPALGETVWAGRGRGCFCNGRPARVSTRTTVDGAYLTTSSFAPWSGGALSSARRSGANLRTWGDGYGYVLAATGRVEAMIDPVAAYYDLAPMPVILAEAGGRFTDLDGNEGPGHGSGVATNGHLHDDVLRLLGGRAARIDTVLG